MITSLIAKIFGTANDRQLKRLDSIVREINSFEPEISALSDEQLANKTNEFRQQLATGKTLDDLLPEAFAVVREVAKRKIGQRHFDVQLMGGIVLHQGKISEMKTGEGKTLTATLPLYLNALGHRWDERDYPTFFSIGGSYEFGRDNTVMDRWLVWGKAGVSF